MKFRNDYAQSKLQPPNIFSTVPNMQPILEDELLETSLGTIDACSSASVETRGRETCLVRGVLFAKSVRSAFCALHVAGAPESSDRDDDGDDGPDTFLIRIQFSERDKVLFRSHCRRFYKNGDLICCYASKSENEGELSTNSNHLGFIRLLIEPENLEDLESIVCVEKTQHWNMKRCQEFQRKHCKTKDVWAPIHSSQKSATPAKPPVRVDQPMTYDDTCSDHGIGIEKRVQTEYVARFFVHMIMCKLYQEHTSLDKMSKAPPFPDSSEWATLSPASTNLALFQQAREFLSNGSGVIDAAGGSGHVSMQLGLLGVKSTVIDSREAVGKLPGRDRKIWNRARMQALSNDGPDTLYCIPVVDYDAKRGWFGPPLQGVDESFRHPDQERLVIYDSKHELFGRCTAVIALHPDEATEAVVDMAVAARKPFAIVPCCVFFRLFPKRLIPGSSQPVSTRRELVEYLRAKHEGIRQTTLPFYGANTILWSTFNV